MQGSTWMSKQKQEDPTEVNVHYLQTAKHELENACNTEQENYIKDKILALEKHTLIKSLE